ncbi:hypothetical protein K4F52_001604 [Lecanicillium sp. MT-2017a]|nr:hypothetical protein K4F52_001604 [Lecanicillium sp. MT-2017a]
MAQPQPTPPPAQPAPAPVDPITTIPPFGQSPLPSCAVACDALYAGNAQCVPPQAPSNAPDVYTQCFCNIPAVAPYRTADTGVCATVCDAAGETSIANWFSSICGITARDNGGGNTPGATGASSSPGSKPTGTKGSSGSSTDNSNQTWISTHWQWVVMIVILVVGIAAIWIGACIWRRRYLRRKDRQSTLGQKSSGSASKPSWGPGLQNSESAAGFYAPRDDTRDTLPSFMSSDEKPRKGKKKWTVTRRT